MGMMAIPLMVGGAAMSAVSQYNTGQHNKTVSNMMADDALRRGDVQGSFALMRGGRADAAAVAAAGGNGVDTGSDSITAARTGSRVLSSFDAATIRSNAMKEAYGLRAQGALAEATGRSGAIGTLLTGTAAAGSAAYSSGALNPGNTDVPGNDFGTAQDPYPHGYPTNYPTSGDYPDFVRG